MESSNRGLLAPLKQSEIFGEISRAVAAGESIEIFGATPSFKPYILSALATLPNRGVLWITGSWESCEKIFEGMYPYLPGPLQQRAGVFPELRTTDRQDETWNNLRIQSLKLLSDGRPGVIVSPFRSVIGDCEDFNQMRKDSVELAVEGEYPQENLIEDLTNLGYERNFQVERRGEFSVRGGIVDVYPSTSGPVRIEFFGDQVDSIRDFDLDSQVSTAKIQSIQIYPRREYSRERRLLDILPKGWIVVVDDPRVIKFQAVERNFEEERDLWGDFQYETNKVKPVYVSSWTGEEGPGLNFKTRPLNSFAGNIEKLLESIPRWQKEGDRVIVSTQQYTRFAELLKEKSIGLTRDPANKLTPGRLLLLSGDFNEGFYWEDERLRLVTDKDILGASPSKRRALRTWDRTRKVSLSDLKAGDVVVHISHGIGQFLGLAHLEIQGVVRDFVQLEYSKGDKLYVPVQQLDLLGKYVGPDGKAARLSKLGGKEWTRARQKAQKAAQEIAEALLNMHAQRETTPGHPFSADTLWQWELEASFPFEETRDQDRAITEVKSDMESSRAMDRLLCGDAGYGKTEVALRAAFKAVQDNKQVALLAPTTILAHQHYETFRQRLGPFPVGVGILSRFRTRKEQKETIDMVSQGKMDVLVGTHRLLSKDVTFPDLGLLIIDEEQHFGVRHKAKLKKMKVNLDVLTMSATPIPRTLHMSMSGIRDLSVIETPPDDRLPVKTYLYEYQKELIRSAIVRELERGGQVYFVTHRVQGIERLAHEISQLVPFAKVAVGHGQMDEQELELVMLDFIDKNYDVLVCTTIIESGLDIPNVNTIIVNNAHRFGLSQLYQLRGRVGRSNRQAYAYLLYPSHVSLTEDAQKRLEVIREFSHLGASFQIAMKDLEIRGAGNLLGPQQSGHIAAVGFDLYCQLLKEAVEELRGTPRKRKLESPQVDLPVDTYIPQDYIVTSQVRLEMYRKIATVDSEEQIKGLADEFVDRFGKIPMPLENLLEILRIKLLAWDLGTPSVKEIQGKVQVLLPGVQKMSLKQIQRLFEDTEVAAYFHRSVLTLEDLLQEKSKKLIGQPRKVPPQIWIRKIQAVLRTLLEWKEKEKL